MRFARIATKTSNNFGWPGSYVEVVKEPGRSSQFLFQLHENALGAEDVRDFAIGVKDVAKFARANRANFETRRILASTSALDTEMTFLHHTLASRTVAEIS